MKLGFQANNFTLQKLNETALELGLPTNQSFIQRRIARAYDLVNTDKVTEVTDGIFKVKSQFEPNKSYIVNLNHGDPSCDCPDGERTINCKHRIAALLFSQKQAKQVIAIIKTTDGDDGDYWRRCWLIAQGNSRPMVYEERFRRLFCNCGAHYEDCEHKQLVIRAVKKELNEKRIVSECGSMEAQKLQDKLNGHKDSQNDNGNGAQNALCVGLTKHSIRNRIDEHKAQTYAPSLDLSNPFEEAEQYDIDQIEERRDGDLAWKLRNGEYVISYKGIMTLSEKHSIDFSEAIHDDTRTIIVKGRCGTSERVSGKPINGNANTALELAKRNAARQLLPYAELKAVEKKAQLEATFDWQKANAKCVELVGEANVSIIIHDLTQAGKLRADNPSHYDRTEWLMIYDACQVERAVALPRLKEASVMRDPKSLNRWSYNSAEFLEQCREAIAQVREKKDAVEANDLPPMNGNGNKRKVQMDKKLRTWLVETDGTKKEISCREICETFESKSPTRRPGGQNPSIVTRLRAGIDSGADISTVEID